MELDSTRQIPSSQPNATMAAADKIYFKQGMQVFGASGGSTPAYYVSDLQGSVRELIEGNSVIAGYEYDPYGYRTKVPGTGLDSDFGFAGYFYHGPTGLNLTRNRVYNAQLGRWLTRDPIGNGFAFASRARYNATNLNLYAYARNNPMSWRDPSGLLPYWQLPPNPAVFLAWALRLANLYNQDPQHMTTRPPTESTPSSQPPSPPEPRSAPGPGGPGPGGPGRGGPGPDEPIMWESEEWGGVFFLLMPTETLVGASCVGRI